MELKKEVDGKLFIWHLLSLYTLCRTLPGQTAFSDIRAYSGRSNLPPCVAFAPTPDCQVKGSLG